MLIPSDPDELIRVYKERGDIIESLRSQVQRLTIKNDEMERAYGLKDKKNVKVVISYQISRPSGNSSVGFPMSFETMPGFDKVKQIVLDKENLPDKEFETINNIKIEEIDDEK